MKIVFLNGGLANQVFQYIFYRYGQVHRPDDEWVLDDSSFFIEKVHNGYELESVFHLQPSLLSHSFDPDVWEYMIQMKREKKKSVPQIFLDNETDIKMVAESPNWSDWNPFSGKVLPVEMNRVDSAITEFSDDIYYHGYWISAGWFRMIETTLRKELIFPELSEPNDIDYFNQIKSSESCSIHIRRGDYIRLGIAASDGYYRERIQAMMKEVPNITLFVFSDDIAYCKLQAQSIGLNLPQRTVYVEGNKGNNAFRDLQLMSCCKNMINANSSFCYLAAILNQNLKRLISPPNRTM